MYFFFTFPELPVYLENFGREKDDYGFAALAVYREYRGQGIGTALLKAILNRLQKKLR